METFVKGFWVLFFLITVAVVGLRGDDDLVNGTTTNQTHGNTNSSSAVRIKAPPAGKVLLK